MANLHCNEPTKPVKCTVAAVEGVSTTMGQWQMYRNHGNSFTQFISLCVAHSRTRTQKMDLDFAYQTERKKNQPSNLIMNLMLADRISFYYLVLPNPVRFPFRLHFFRTFTNLHFSWICDFTLQYLGIGLTRFLWVLWMISISKVSFVAHNSLAKWWYRLSVLLEEKSITLCSSAQDFKSNSIEWAELLIKGFHCIHLSIKRKANILMTCFAILNKLRYSPTILCSPALLEQSYKYK